MARMGLGLRMPDYSSFIRSVRTRYLSGLLMIALAAATAMYGLNRINSFRHEIDTISANLAELTKELRNAADFSDTAYGNWRAGTRGDLANVARNYVQRISGEIAALSKQIQALSPRMSKQTLDTLDTASVNGDLFWSAKDMVRNLNLMAAAITVDDWSPRAIRNQNNLFAQPMLMRIRTAMDDERHRADAHHDANRGPDIGDQVLAIGLQGDGAILLRRAEQAERDGEVERGGDDRDHDAEPGALDANGMNQPRDRGPDDGNRRGDDKHSLQPAREILGLAMPVGMLLVRLLRGDMESDQRRDGGHEVDDRLQGIGKEANRAGEPPGGGLQCDGGDRRRDGEPGEPGERAGASGLRLLVRRNV